MNEKNFPRVGQINFLNVLPLTYGFDNGYSQGLKIVADVPAKLNEKLRRGELDISPISSIAYARQSENLFLLPKICIRADDDVTSIIFLSKKPVEQIRDDKIILTSKSETSHCLLKIILQSYGANPNYQIRDVDVARPIDDDATGALLIGDDALYNYLHTPKKFFLYDIGREWHKLTGHSVFYAVWAVQKNFAENFPEKLRTAYEKILDAFEFGKKNKSAAINSVLNQKPFTLEELNKYLGGIIKWDMTTDGLEGLKIFYEKAFKLGLIEKIPEINFVHPLSDSEL